jgi:3',5'-cyclic AMP phosphodiesterase CpdA
MLTIAQITDLHITTAANPTAEVRNAARLRATLATIHALRPRPAAIIATGDLTDTGSAAEYAALADILSSTEIPLYLGVGNHDRRVGALAAFGPPMIAADAAGFVQYAADIGPLRLVMVDSVDDGRDDGEFCETRAAWLARTLDAAPGRPTVLAIHHPPIPSGIQWMDPPPAAPWMGRLAAVLSGRRQILTVVCGHIHRPYHALFAGHLVSVSAATSLQLTLNLTAIDRRVADGRQILLGEPPGFTLLAWDGARLTTHTGLAGDFPDAITYERPFVAG